MYEVVMTPSGVDHLAQDPMLWKRAAIILAWVRQNLPEYEVRVCSHDPGDGADHVLLLDILGEVDTGLPDYLQAMDLSGIEVWVTPPEFEGGN